MRVDQAAVKDQLRPGTGWRISVWLLANMTVTRQMSTLMKARTVCMSSLSTSLASLSRAAMGAVMVLVFARVGTGRV